MILRLQKSRDRGDLIIVLMYQKEGKNLFTIFTWDITGINELILQLRRFRLDIRQIFLIVRTLKPRIDFLKDAAETS